MEGTPIPLSFGTLLVWLYSNTSKIISAVVIFLIGWLLAKFLARAVTKVMEKRQADQQAVLLVSKLTYWSMVILTLFTALLQVGFNLTAFLASLGIAGLTIGFALQDVSKNFVAGLLLLMDKPFNVGEVIEVTGYTGKVLYIDVRATRMETTDGRIVLIPNADVITNPIVNFTQANRRRIDILLSVAHGSDLEKARKAALQAAQAVPGLVREPPPQLISSNITPNAIELTLSYWIDTAQSDPVNSRDAAIAAVDAAFREAEIKMPPMTAMSGKL